MSRQEDFSDGFLSVVWGILLFLAVVGITSNAIILYLFAVTKSLRTPMNWLFITLTVNDFLVCCCGTLPACLLTMTRTMLNNKLGCNVFGFVTYFGGTGDAIALMAIAIERYITIAKPLGIGACTKNRAFAWFIFEVISGIFIAGLPLVGVSEYVKEGYGAWCSVNWEVQNLMTDIFNYVSFVYSYFGPIVIIIACYAVVTEKVRQVAKTGASESSVRAQKQVTRQAIVMVIGFLIGWTPYAIVCLYVTIGKHNVFGPQGAMFPAMLAKSSFCYNPFIYVGLNKQFRSAFVEKITRGYDPFAKKTDKKESAAMTYDASVAGAVSGHDNKGADIPTVSKNVEAGGPTAMQKVTGDAAKVAPAPEEA